MLISFSFIPLLGHWQRPVCSLYGKAVLGHEGPHFLQSFSFLESLLPTWAKFGVSELSFLQSGQAILCRGEPTPKAKEWASTPQLINIVSILTNGRPESQTEQPLGHMAGVCPGALRTLSGRAQVPSIFLCTAPAPTSHVSLLSRLGWGSCTSQRRFIPQDWPTWTYVSKFTKAWVWWQATKGQRKSRQGV